MATDEEREQLVQDMMRSAGMRRDEAVFAVAIELGEIDGDLIEVEGETAAAEGRRPISPTRSR